MAGSGISSKNSTLSAMALYDLKRRITLTLGKCSAAARKVKLSAWVRGLFVIAFILPWCVYAWLTLNERADVLRRADDSFAALTATYGEAGAAQVVALTRDQALEDWRDHAEIGFGALLLRSLFVVLIGLFLVEQLRRRE